MTAEYDAQINAEVMSALADIIPPPLHGQARAALAVDNYMLLLSLAGRDNGPYVASVLYCHGCLWRNDAAAVLKAAWSMPDYPLQCLPAEDWVALFTEIFCGGPQRRRRVYRAQVTGMPQGMSWTTDLAIARLFGRRCRGPWRLLTGLVSPRDVLALVDDREEAEVVLRPDWEGWTIMEESAEVAARPTLYDHILATA